MKVAVDNNILAWLLSNGQTPPKHPDTGEDVRYAEHRLQELKRRVSEGQIQPLVIPMPVVGELFSVAPDAREKYLSILNDSMTFSLCDFDMMSAIELSDVNNTYYAAGDKRAGQNGSWAKIKADRMIFSIAKANGVTTMYTDDRGLTAVCESNGITVKHSWELPLPPAIQTNMFDE